MNAEDIWIDERRREPLEINNNLFSFEIQQCDRRIIAFVLPPRTHSHQRSGSKHYLGLFISVNFCSPFFPLHSRRASFSHFLPPKSPATCFDGYCVAAFCTQSFRKMFPKTFSPCAREHFYVRINYETSFQRYPPAWLVAEWRFGFFFVCVRSVKWNWIDRRWSLRRTKLLFFCFRLQIKLIILPSASLCGFRFNFLIVSF